MVKNCLIIEWFVIKKTKSLFLTIQNPDFLKAQFQILWGSEIRPFEIQKHLRCRLFEGWISNGRALATAIATVPTIKKPDHSKIWIFLYRFQTVFDKMVALCPDFKWSCFWISDPIRNPTTSFLTIQNPDWSVIQISTIVTFKIVRL